MHLREATTLLPQLALESQSTWEGKGEGASPPQEDEDSVQQDNRGMLCAQSLLRLLLKLIDHHHHHKYLSSQPQEGREERSKMKEAMVMGMMEDGMYRLAGLLRRVCEARPRVLLEVRRSLLLRTYWKTDHIPLVGLLVRVGVLMGEEVDQLIAHHLRDVCEFVREMGKEGRGPMPGGGLQETERWLRVGVAWVREWSGKGEEIGAQGASRQPLPQLSSQSIWALRQWLEITEEGGETGGSKGANETGATSTLRDQVKEAVALMQQNGDSAAPALNTDESPEDTASQHRSRLALLFLEWVKLYRQRRYGERNYRVFVEEIHRNGLLGSEAATALFVRTAVEVAMTEWNRVTGAGRARSGGLAQDEGRGYKMASDMPHIAMAPHPLSPTDSTRDEILEKFVAVDALGKLLVLCVLYHPPMMSKVTGKAMAERRRSFLQMVLFPLVTLLLAQMEGEGTGSFRVSPWHRLFQGVLIELEEADGRGKQLSPTSTDTEASSKAGGSDGERTEDGFTGGHALPADGLSYDPLTYPYLLQAFG